MRPTDPLQKLPSDTNLDQGSLSDQVYERLLSWIVDGTLPSGTELTTAGLAKQLHISRTPIIRALQNLVFDGLVEWPIRKPPRVATLSADDVTQVFQVRSYLEAFAAELASERMPQEVCSELIASFKEIQTTTTTADWIPRAYELDLRLHRTIAHHCGNHYLEKDIHRFLRLVRVGFSFTADIPTVLQGIHDHIAILEAIEAGDPASARLAMSGHLLGTRDVLLAVLQEKQANSAPDGS